MDHRTVIRHAGEAGAHHPGLSAAFNECFTFNSNDEYELIKRLHPELFDTNTSPRDRAKRWKAFGQTSVGRALRTR